MRKLLYCFLSAVLFSACNGQNTSQPAAQPQQPAPTAAAEPKVDSVPAATDTGITTTYRMLRSRDSIKHFTKSFSPAQQAVILAVNRVDAEHIVKLDTIIIPNEYHSDILAYSPYPRSLPFLQDVSKVIFFSYPAQYFGAYERGQLIHSGPTNMGRKQYQTPTGLFYTNWKAEKTRSTFDDEWELKWNFNIQNKEGIAWHQYALPGFPASHSCLRLLEDDAKYLYDWADEWVTKGENNILAQGTPVIVFGAYPFGQGKPWLRLPADPHVLDINANTLQQLITPYLADIKVQQEKRAHRDVKK